MSGAAAKGSWQVKVYIALVCPGWPPDTQKDFESRGEHAEKSNLLANGQMGYNLWPAEGKPAYKSIFPSEEIIVMKKTF